MVTHDNRILDIADRIINLEDGRLSSFASAVISNTQHMVSMLALNNRKGDLTRQVQDLSVPQFRGMLDQVTGEAHQLLQAFDMSENEAIESMLEQVIEAFTLKVGQLLNADRVTLFLVDETTGELWSKVAQSEGEVPLEIRTPRDAGIVGRVATTGQSMNIPDAYQEPLFNPAVDQRTGYHTRSILTVPLVDSHSHVFAVVQLLNKADGAAFDHADEERVAEFASPMAVILETWARFPRRR
jgi:adenylate cyclase